MITRLTRPVYVSIFLAVSVLGDVSSVVVVVVVVVEVRGKLLLELRGSSGTVCAVVVGDGVVAAPFGSVYSLLRIIFLLFGA